METRAMAASARTKPDSDTFSGRAFAIALVVVLVALAGFAFFVRYGR